jgi:hemerythrin-like domain-containing protein
LLRDLINLTEQTNGGALSPSQCESISAALQAFQQEITRYRQDEETSFFPRMRQAEGREIQSACEKIPVLEDNHWLARFEHSTVERIAPYWISGQRLTRSEYGVFCNALDTLSRLYRRHIDLEEAEILPLATRALATAA